MELGNKRIKIKEINKNSLPLCLKAVEHKYGRNLSNKLKVEKINKEFNSSITEQDLIDKVSVEIEDVKQQINNIGISY